MRIISTISFLLIATYCFAQTADTSKVVIIGNCWGNTRPEAETKMLSCILQEIDPSRFVSNHAKKDTIKKPIQIFPRCGSSKPWEPLTIIDGLAAKYEKIRQVNPDDIQSIYILKRAEAMAIYGSSGYNGALIIVTEKKAVKKIIVKDSLETGLTGFKVYPSPVIRGNQVAIQLNKESNENVNLRVLGTSKTNLILQPLQTIKGNNNFQLMTDARWAAGIYFVQLVYENGRLGASQKIIIQ